MTRDKIKELTFQRGIWIPMVSGPELEQTIDRLFRFARIVVQAE